MTRVRTCRKSPGKKTGKQDVRTKKSPFFSGIFLGKQIAFYGSMVV